MQKYLSIALLALTFAVPAAAETCSQLQDNSTRLACFEDQSRCMQIAEHDERLACFDQHDYRRQATNVRQTPPEPVTGTVTTAAAVSAPAAAVASAPVVEITEPTLATPAPALAPEAVPNSTPAPVAAPTPAPEITAEVAIAERTPVPVEDPFPVRDASPKETDKPPAPQLNAIINSVVRDHRDLAILTLDNGQVWRELKKSRFRYKADMAVLITQGVMGSTNLKAEGMKKFVKVKRLR